MLGVLIPSSLIPFWNAKFKKKEILFYFHFTCDIFMMMMFCCYFILKLQIDKIIIFLFSQLQFQGYS